MLCSLTRWDFNFYIRSSPLQNPMQRKVEWRSGPNKLNGQSVGALSPVNHKGLYQGWYQTSLYRHIIHYSSNYTTGLFFKNHSTNSIHNFGMQTKKNKTYFWDYLFSADTQQAKLHPAVWPILFWGPAKATINTGKNWERFCTKWETSDLGLKWGEPAEGVGVEVRWLVMEWGEVGHDGMRWGGS